MAYTPTYDPADLTNITTDVVAKLFITAGTLAAVIIIAVIIYLFMRRR